MSDPIAIAMEQLHHWCSCGMTHADILHAIGVPLCDMPIRITEDGVLRHLMRAWRELPPAIRRNARGINSWLLK